MARELAMQAMYQLDVQGDDYLDQMEIFLKENCSDDMVFELANTWSRQAWKNLTICDGLIKQAAIKWELSRLSSVDRSILRLATYQLKFCPDIPGKVVINEAIEIAKKYSGQQSPGFVNGVLDAILKKLKQPEKEVSH
jgi:transcription antitermination factor NusB